MEISPLFQTTYRGNFIAGWDKYVKHGLFGQPDPPTDVYWNPRMGQWQKYAANGWTITDPGLASIPVPTFVVNVGEIFDGITQQWSAMPSAQMQHAIWDGRLYRWVLAEPRGDGGTTCRQHFENVLAFLRQLHTDGKLDDDQFNNQVGQLFKQYEHCL